MLTGCGSGFGARVLSRFDVDLSVRADGVSIDIAPKTHPTPAARADRTPDSAPTPPDSPPDASPEPVALPTSPPATQAIPLTQPTAAPRTAPAAQSPLAEYPADLAIAWMDLALHLVQTTPGYSPPVAARTFGYLGITLYETLQPGLPDHATLAGQLQGLDSLPVPQATENAHWPLAANHALAQALRYYFPTTTVENQQAIAALEENTFARLYRQGDDATIAQATAWGETIAQAVYAWSTEDGGHQGYLRNFPSTYHTPTATGSWVSTPPAYAAALLPYWGENRPFVLPAGDACPSPPPVAYSELPGSDFYAQALEVYEVGRNRTAEQIAIAQFWSDDPGNTATPGGHWMSILSQALTREQAKLPLAAEAYARLGIALNDAFITCWHTKYDHNVVRPITYIQTVIDPNWNITHSIDPVGTPPFPEYTSGHSVQSSAAAAVLTALFGPDYAFTDDTHAQLGLAPREFSSFEAAAQEAAISRLYGGIHYRMAIEAGLDQGACVAASVNQLVLAQDGDQ
ncbi:MAG: vanadium-dependent haloperoxidase [Litorilinea sp.]